MHMIERALIHFFASCSLTLIVYFALRFWSTSNKKVSDWVGTSNRHLLLLAALLVFALAELREPFDVASGQTVAKAVTDFISWFAGCAVSAWGLYRFGGKQ